jgi:MerR family transcriptional regulator, copper efflux regulator
MMYVGISSSSGGRGLRLYRETAYDVDMPTELPIACSLTPGAAAERAQQWRELGADALVEKAGIAGGVRLRFRDSATNALETLVAAERECCPFLDLKIRRSGATVELDVTGPAEAAPIIAAFTGS